MAEKKEEAKQEEKKEENPEEKKEENPEEKKEDNPDDIETVFDQYSKLHDEDGDKGITLENIIKLFSQAKITEDKTKNVSEEDVKRAYNTIAKDATRVKLPEFKKIISNLATEKKMKDQGIVTQLIAAGKPESSDESDQPTEAEKFEEKKEETIQIIKERQAEEMEEKLEGKTDEKKGENEEEKKGGKEDETKGGQEEDKKGGKEEESMGGKEGEKKVGKEEEKKGDMEGEKKGKEMRRGLMKEEEMQRQLMKEKEKEDEEIKPEEKEVDKPDDIKTLFEQYSQFGDKNGHNGITLKNTMKWFSQSEIIDDKSKNITREDITTAYNSIAKDQDRITFPEFRKVIRKLGTEKKLMDEDILTQLVAAGRPKISGVSDFFSTLCKSCKSKN